MSLRPNIGVRPEVRVSVGQPVETFYCNSSHTAHIVLSNPTSWPWTYWCSVTSAGAFWAGEFTVTVPAGGSSSLIDVLGTAPPTPMTLPLMCDVRLDNAEGEVLFRGQIATIEVIEEAVPDVDVVLSWD